MESQGIADNKRPKETMTERKVISLRQLSHATYWSYGTLANWLKEGRLPAPIRESKRGSALLFDLNEVLDRLDPDTDRANLLLWVKNNPGQLH